MSPCKTVLLAISLAGISTLAHAQVNMGMVGDSLTDDYLGGNAAINNNLAAYSWGQILAETRGDDINFGGYRDTSNPWDTSVRYSGYEYNWATSGGFARDNATIQYGGLAFRLPADISGASALSTQTAGLAQNIANGDVGTAYVGIGSNDFFYQSTIITGTDGSAIPNPDIVIDQTFIDEMASSILAGVDTLLNAGEVDLLLGLLPPGTAGGATPDVLAGIEAVNALLVQGAADRGVAVVDIFGWNEDPGRVNPDGSVNIGNLTVDMSAAASAADLSADGTGPCNDLGMCATESHALYGSAEDGLHPNTLIQGLIANQIIAALNDNYGYGIAELSDQEILSVAGVSAVPVPAAAWLFASGLVGLAGIKRRRSQQA